MVCGRCWSCRWRTLRVMDFVEADASVMHRAHFFVMASSQRCLLCCGLPGGDGGGLAGRAQQSLCLLRRGSPIDSYDNGVSVSRIRTARGNGPGVQRAAVPLPFETATAVPARATTAMWRGWLAKYMVPAPRFASSPLPAGGTMPQPAVRGVRGHRDEHRERLRRDCEALTCRLPFDACDRRARG